MPGVRKSLLAEQDLINIWLYTHAEWGEKQADKYLDDIETSILQIAEQPLLNRERTEFTPVVRISISQHHLIVYTLSDNDIFIVRILHENMDIEQQLNDD